MFLGWRCGDDDINKLLEYNNGELKFDLLNKKIYFNGNEINISLYIFEEIREWFIQNTRKEKIDIHNICEAFIKINNKAEEIICKNSRTKRKVNMEMRITGYIRTDEKEYITEKNKTEKYHYV
jgi:uncharacterized ubiquitin-like protein YukD